MVPACPMPQLACCRRGWACKQEVSGTPARTHSSTSTTLCAVFFAILTGLLAMYAAVFRTLDQRMTGKPQPGNALWGVGFLPACLVVVAAAATETTVCTPLERQYSRMQASASCSSSLLPATQSP